MTKRFPSSKLDAVVMHDRVSSCTAFAAGLSPLAVVALACACSSHAVIATWTCSPPDSGYGNGAFELPWSSGFEDGFCSYLTGGFCTPDEHKIVESPVHSGHYAAAYTVTSSGNQSRCFRDGVLPDRALYGAWFYIPSATSADVASDWNIVHFQDYNLSKQGWDNTFDVLLVNDDNAGLHVQAWDQIKGAHYEPSLKVPIPIGSWFHIEVLLKRATDSTGEIVIYQNGTNILDQSGLTTELSARGQWYVGNYWANLTASESTVYVDDVAVSAAP